MIYGNQSIESNLMDIVNREPRQVNLLQGLGPASKNFEKWSN